MIHVQCPETCACICVNIFILPVSLSAVLSLICRIDIHQSILFSVLIIYLMWMQWNWNCNWLWNEISDFSVAFIFNLIFHEYLLFFSRKLCKFKGPLYAFAFHAPKSLQAKFKRTFGISDIFETHFHKMFYMIYK